MNFWLIIFLVQFISGIPMNRGDLIGRKSRNRIGLKRRQRDLIGFNRLANNLAISISSRRMGREIKSIYDQMLSSSSVNDSTKRELIKFLRTIQKT